MFEGSLVESCGLIVSRTQRWSTLGSAAFQLMLAALIVMIPLLRPQTPTHLLPAPPLLTAPPPPRPPEPPVRVQTASEAAPQALSAPAAPAPTATGIHISLIPGVPNDPAPGPITSLQLGPGPTGMPRLSEEHVGPSVAVVRAGPNRTLTVSGGVSQGMLLTPIQPVYPEIARVTHTQGTVVVEATISKAGRVESAHTTSGPPMLLRAALDAVAAARYRPYLLSGEPVEVQTTVTVVFKMGGE